MKRQLTLRHGSSTTSRNVKVSKNPFTISCCCQTICSRCWNVSWRSGRTRIASGILLTLWTPFRQGILPGATTQKQGKTSQRTSANSLRKRKHLTSRDHPHTQSLPILLLSRSHPWSLPWSAPLWRQRALNTRPIRRLLGRRTSSIRILSGCCIWRSQMRDFLRICSPNSQRSVPPTNLSSATRPPNPKRPRPWMRTPQATFSACFREGRVWVPKSHGRCRWMTMLFRRWGGLWLVRRALAPACAWPSTWLTRTTNAARTSRKSVRPPSPTQSTSTHATWCGITGTDNVQKSSASSATTGRSSRLCRWPSFMKSTEMLKNDSQVWRATSRKGDWTQPSNTLATWMRKWRRPETIRCDQRWIPDKICRITWMRGIRHETRSYNRWTRSL